MSRRPKPKLIPDAEALVIRETMFAVVLDSNLKGLDEAGQVDQLLFKIPSDKAHREAVINVLHQFEGQVEDEADRQMVRVLRQLSQSPTHKLRLH